jgi:hypothetical protein
MKGNSFDLDMLASRLAARHGQAWHEMGDFPGYMRNVWRETARNELLGLVPGAIVEPLPPRCDGRDGGWQVHLP